MNPFLILLLEILLIPLFLIIFEKKIQTNQEESNKRTQEIIDSKQDERLTELSERMTNLEIALADLVCLLNDDCIEENYGDS